MRQQRGLHQCTRMVAFRKIWRSRFKNYLIASEINKNQEATQCAQLLDYIGEGRFQIYSTLKFEEVEKNQLQKLIDKFEILFLPKENIIYERYKLFS